MVNYLSRRKRPLRLVSNGVVPPPLLLRLDRSESLSVPAKPPRSPTLLRFKHASPHPAYTVLRPLSRPPVASLSPKIHRFPK